MLKSSSITAGENQVKGEVEMREDEMEVEMFTVKLKGLMFCLAIIIDSGLPIY